MPMVLVRDVAVRNFLTFENTTQRWIGDGKMYAIPFNEFKVGIILETAERLRANGYEKEAKDLEWDVTVMFLVESFCPPEWR